MCYAATTPAPGAPSASSMFVCCLWMSVDGDLSFIIRMKGAITKGAFLLAKMQDSLDGNVGSGGHYFDEYCP